MNGEKEYRPDIDGLRGIAVLAVFFYHLGFKSLFGGGYVGVDIFFVISGYLITRIIANELDAGTFRFAKFYARRIRRILPAFIVLCLACFFVGRLLLSPAEFFALCQSMARSSIAMSNFYFYEHTGYFDIPARSSPFLHTWSLSIEEQFYFIFPLLLFLIYKFVYSARLYIVVALFSVSLGLSFLVFYDQSFAFFMLPARAWELLLGSMAAMIPLRPFSERQARTMRVAGLSLIMGTIVLYRWLPNIYFPGLAAFPPCLGTFLCLVAGAESNASKSIVFRVLTSKALVFVGLISYSLYLWHWPVIAYTRLYLPYLTVSAAIIAAIIPLCFILATLSWKFIEQPIRKKQILASNRTLVPVALCSLACIFLVTMEYKKYFAPKFSPDAEKYLASEWDAYPLIQSSRLESVGFALGKDSPIPRFLLIGDSHAGMLFKHFDSELAEKNISGFCIGGKNQFLGMQSLYGHAQAEQDNLVKFVTAQTVHTAVLSSRWSQYSVGLIPWELETLSTDIWPVTYEYNGKKIWDHYDALYASLNTTVQLLLENGVKSIYIIQPIPEHNFFPPSAAARLIQRGTNPEEVLYTPMSDYLARHDGTRKLIQRLADAYPEVTVIDLMPLLAPDGERCLTLRDGKSLYTDDDHLSTFGAQQMAPALAPIFETARKNEDMTH